MRGVGRTLIAAGTLLLLFVAYQLWGTALQEARAQDRLARSFEEALAAAGQDPDGSSSPATPPLPGGEDGIPSPAPPAPEVVPGDAVALLRIPRIGVDKVVVEGVGADDLRKGPGHYPGTPLPGQPGNAAVAGHRTTYGQPFYRLDELEAGDEIRVVTLQGSFRYEVEGSRVVGPDAVEVLAPTDDARLTITTCHPRFSASKRLVVTAVLADEPAPAAPTPVEPSGDTGDSGDSGDPAEPAGPAGPAPEGPDTGDAPTSPDDLHLGGDPDAVVPAVAWGGVAALVALAAWLVGRRWRRWPAYLLGAPLFLVPLFVCYEHVARALPADI